MPLVPVLDGYETVAEMEAGLSMPAGSLEKTLARYNHHAALGEDPDFGKSAERGQHAVVAHGVRHRHQRDRAATRLRA